MTHSERVTYREYDGQTYTTIVHEPKVVTERTTKGTRILIGVIDTDHVLYPCKMLYVDLDRVISREVLE